MKLILVPDGQMNKGNDVVLKPSFYLIKVFRHSVVFTVKPTQLKVWSNFTIYVIASDKVSFPVFDDFCGHQFVFWILELFRAVDFSWSSACCLSSYNVKQSCLCKLLALLASVLSLYPEFWLEIRVDVRNLIQGEEGYHSGGTIQKIKDRKRRSILNRFKLFHA